MKAKSSARWTVLLWLTLILAAAYTLLGCSGAESESATTTTTSTATGCEPGELVGEAGDCVPAGLPPEVPVCPPGETAGENGSCAPAGVPEGGCGVGFVHDGEGGCKPLVAPGPCASGTMAVLGSTECQEVAPCGEGKWGDIPLEDGAIFVDASAAGPGSGTMDDPFPTIGHAIVTASSGSLIVVAAGTYNEELHVNKAVRVWGVCPAAVEIVGDSPDVFAVEITASDAELHRVSVTGPYAGIGTTKAGSVKLDRVRVHDTGNIGIQVYRSAKSTVELDRVLVERAFGAGILVIGADATIADTSVLGTGGVPQVLTGGILIMDDNGMRSTVSVLRSILDGNTGANLASLTSTTTVEDTLIQNAVEIAGFAAGAMVRTDMKDVPLGELSLKRCVVRGGTTLGVASASGSLDVYATTITGLEIGEYGASFGVSVDQSPVVPAPPVIHVEKSKVSDVHGVGADIGGATGTVASTLVRDIHGGSTNAPGWGVVVDTASNAKGPSSDITVTDCAITQVEKAGLTVFGSHATVDRTAIFGLNEPSQPGAAGPAVGVFVIRDEVKDRRASATVRWSEMRGIPGAGVSVVDSDVDLYATWIHDIVTPSTGMSSAAGVIAGVLSPAQPRPVVSVEQSLIEGTEGMGISVSNTELAVTGSVVRRTKPIPGLPFGIGISTLDSLVSLASSRIDENKGIAVGTVDSDAKIGGCTFAGNVPGKGFAGIGLIASGGTLDVEDSLFSKSSTAGAQLFGGAGTFRRVVFEETKIQPSNMGFGDGLEIVSQEGHPATAVIEGCTFRHNARAGLAVWGALVEVGSSSFLCNTFDLNVEPNAGYEGEIKKTAAVQCGCDGETVDCSISSEGFVPPDPLGK